MKSTEIICPLCQDKVDKLVYRFHYASERTVIERIREEFPQWAKEDGLCSRCLDFFYSQIAMERQVLPSVGPQFPIKTGDDFVVIPTGLRLNADPRFTGKGVTICFVDSGYFPHPDLVGTRNRIRKVIDVTRPGEFSPGTDDRQISDSSWHGTMTSVVCAGDGYSSNGLYKGIACDAGLVLLKVQDDGGKILSGNIVRALKWILAHHREFNIRIVNISLGADETVSIKESELDKLTEQLNDQGIVIVAAVGNDVASSIKPPANSLHVIAVGGVDDENKIDGSVHKMYHSSYGKTLDELMKPELVAPAMWVAAPILPGTETEKEAETLYYLSKLDNGSIIDKLKELSRFVKLDDSVYESRDPDFIRKKIMERIRTCKYISPHYLHVDGTSFAAPIVSSLIAQLLEINPDLSPVEIREIIFSTAKRIDGVAAERQGFGIIQPRKAVLKTLKRQIFAWPESSPKVNPGNKTIGFYVQNECAYQLSVAGSFNQWAPDIFLMEAGNNGLWKVEIPMLPPGKYLYKFFVDEKNWIEDFRNPYREPDGFDGFNSVLIVEKN